MKLATDPRAKEDIERIVVFLNSRRRGAGNAFYRAYKSAFRLIAANPRSFGITEDAIPGIESREFILERYNYRVVYALSDSRGIVLAIIHAARPYSLWKTRLSPENEPESMS